MCLAKGDDALVSHRAAMALWKLPGFGSGSLELIVPRTSGGSASPGVILHRIGPIPSADVTVLDGIRVTTASRTLVDIASISSTDLVEEAIDDALRRGLVSRPRLRWQLSKLSARGRRGIGVVRAIVADRDETAQVPQSVFETKVLRRLRAAGLPEPVRQYEIREAGRHVATVDFALPDLRIAIEADSFRWHGSRLRFERDLARRNAIASLDWELFHLTWADLEEGNGEAINTIARVSRARRGAPAG